MQAVIHKTPVTSYFDEVRVLHDLQVMGHSDDFSFKHLCNVAHGQLPIPQSSDNPQPMRVTQCLESLCTELRVEYFLSHGHTIERSHSGIRPSSRGNETVRGMLARQKHKRNQIRNPNTNPKILERRDLFCWEPGKVFWGERIPKTKTSTLPPTCSGRRRKLAGLICRPTHGPDRQQPMVCCN